jgi:hypothetical protein
MTAVKPLVDMLNAKETNMDHVYSRIWAFDGRACILAFTHLRSHAVYSTSVGRKRCTGL